MAMVTVVNKTKHAFDVHEDGRGSKHLRFVPGRNVVDSDDLHDVLDAHDANPVVRAWFESGELEIERPQAPEQEPASEGESEQKPAG